MIRSSTLWRFIHPFQSVNAILLTWNEKEEKEGPIISPSISDFVYDVYCLKELVLIHDDTQMQMNTFRLRLRPFKTAITSLFISPQPFKSNIAMRAKFNFHI